MGRGRAKNEAAWLEDGTEKIEISEKKRGQ